MKFRIGISNLESDKKKTKIHFIFMMNNHVLFEQVFELSLGKTFDLKLSAKSARLTNPENKFSDN